MKMTKGAKLIALFFFPITFLIEVLSLNFFQCGTYHTIFECGSSSRLRVKFHALPDAILQMFLLVVSLAIQTVFFSRLRNSLHSKY